LAQPGSRRRDKSIPDELAEQKRQISSATWLTAVRPDKGASIFTYLTLIYMRYGICPGLTYHFLDSVATKMISGRGRRYVSWLRFITLWSHCAYLERFRGVETDCEGRSRLFQANIRRHERSRGPDYIPPKLMISTKRQDHFQRLAACERSYVAMKTNNCDRFSRSSRKQARATETGRCQVASCLCCISRIASSS
jgi:hypothetical protein